MPEIDAARLGREIAAHVLDALNEVGFGAALAERVAARVNTDLEMFTMQGWAQVHVHPAWSRHCLDGQHGSCDGTAPPSEVGCHCPHHRGEPLPQHGYRLLLVERTADDYRAEGGEPRA